jgi:iron complex outermembrane receptor protein
VPRVSARLAYTYQDFAFTEFVAPEGDFSGRREPGVPPHQLFVGASYEAPSGLVSAAEFRSVAAYPVNSSNTIANWAYRVMNLRFGLKRQWKDVDLRPFVGVDNVFGERYNASAITNSVGDRFFEPAPGREIYVGLTIGGPLF